MRHSGLLLLYGAVVCWGACLYIATSSAHINLGFALQIAVMPHVAVILHAMGRWDDESVTYKRSINNK